MHSSKILGTGSYLPSRTLTNADLEKLVETTDEWILERTGIRSRHIAAKNEVTSDLALHAAQKALLAAGLKPENLDVIIFATVTPDQPMPSAACTLQAKLKCREIMAFDISAACTGFLYGFSIADQFIRSGLYQNVLVIGAEILSRIVNYEDRGTCILFGDGAGAAIIGRAESSPSAVLGSCLGADGNLGDLLTLPGGGSRIPTTQTSISEGLHFIHMKGREVFKAAVRSMSQSCLTALEAADISANEVKWFIPHQANRRIIESIGNQLGIPLDRVITNIEDTGNTSSASIPVAFDQAVRDGRIQRGDIILETAFGAGLTFGALVFRY